MSSASLKSELLFSCAPTSSIAMEMLTVRDDRRTIEPHLGWSHPLQSNFVGDFPCQGSSKA
eukprot:1422390-Amphidinium_carterae.1